MKFLQAEETGGCSGKKTSSSKIFLNVDFLSFPLNGVFPY